MNKIEKICQYFKYINMLIAVVLTISLLGFVLYAMIYHFNNSAGDMKYMFDVSYRLLITSLLIFGAITLQLKDKDSFYVWVLVVLSGLLYPNYNEDKVSQKLEIVEQIDKEVIVDKKKEK